MSNSRITRTFVSRSEQETVDFGRRLGRLLKPGDVVCLFGDLGTGKTTLVKGVARAMGIRPERVNSPTFVLMNVYEGKWPLYHFDFYRLDEPREIEMIGTDEFLYGDGVTLVEWAGRFGHFLPRERLNIYLTHRKGEARGLQVKPAGERYVRLAGRLGEA